MWLAQISCFVLYHIESIPTILWKGSSETVWRHSSLQEEPYLHILVRWCYTATKLADSIERKPLQELTSHNVFLSEPLFGQIASRRTRNISMSLPSFHHSHSPWLLNLSGEIARGPLSCSVARFKNGIWCQGGLDQTTREVAIWTSLHQELLSFSKRKPRNLLAFGVVGRCLYCMLKCWLYYTILCVGLHVHIILIVTSYYLLSLLFQQRSSGGSDSELPGITPKHNKP